MIQYVILSSHLHARVGQNITFQYNIVQYNIITNCDLNADFKDFPDLIYIKSRTKHGIHRSRLISATTLNWLALCDLNV